MESTSGFKSSIRQTSILMGPVASGAAPAAWSSARKNAGGRVCFTFDHHSGVLAKMLRRGLSEVRFDELLRVLDVLDWFLADCPAAQAAPWRHRTRQAAGGSKSA